jgi:UDP-glucose 4-epimerase
MDKVRKMKRIIITGSNGLVGSSVLEGLRDLECSIVTVDKSKSPSVQSADHRVIELTSESATAELTDIAADIVVHCAALIPTPSVQGSDEEVARVNASIDAQVMEACEKTNAFLIFISSASVYGLHGAPWSENAATNPGGEYARQKLETERSIRRRVKDHVIFRLSAPYGPRQSNATVMSVFIERALSGMDLEVFGSGERVQDFIFARDVGLACRKAIGHDARGTYNLGGGRPTSMAALARMITEEVPNQSSSVRFVGDDPQEAIMFALNIKKMESGLAWRPVTSLRQGVKEMISNRDTTT